MTSWQVDKIHLISSQWFSSIFSKASASVWSSSRSASVNSEVVSFNFSHFSQNCLEAHCSSSTCWRLFFSYCLYSPLQSSDLPKMSRDPFWASIFKIDVAIWEMHHLCIELNSMHSSAYMHKRPKSCSMVKIQV